jgi:hypothetical protein
MQPWRIETKLTLSVLIAQRSLTHIGQLNGAFAGSVHEPIAADRVEFGGCDDLGELLHIGRLDVHDVETLVLNVQVPQVDPQVI